MNKPTLLLLCLAVSACGVGMDAPPTPPSGDGLTRAAAFPQAPPLTPATPAAPPVLPSLPGRQAAACEGGFDAAVVSLYSHAGGLFTVDGAGTLRRFDGEGCHLEAALDWVYTETRVQDGLLSVGAEDAYVSLGSSVQQVNARHCGELTASPFRWVEDLAVSPSAQRLVVKSCGVDVLHRRTEPGWEVDASHAAVLQGRQPLARVTFIDEARLMGVGYGEELRTLDLANDTVTDHAGVNLEGHGPVRESLRPCPGGVCLTYPSGNFVAVFGASGEVVDVVRGPPLGEGEVLAGGVLHPLTGAATLLVRGPHGARLAVAP